MNVTEQLLGFDARIMGTELAASWTEERRNIYLLRRDADPILSTDVLVWPSLFSKKLLVSVGPPTVNTALFLWCDLQGMFRYLENDNHGTRELPWAIAITLVTRDISNDEQKLWDPFLWTPIPASVNPNWVFFGYDVSDMALLSGLSNCGYKSEDREQFIQRYFGYINQYHLFSDLDLATEFKDITNKRVPEHSPFFVYGLYKIVTGEGI